MGDWRSSAGVPKSFKGFPWSKILDGMLGGSWKTPVRVATTVAGTLATSFENGDTIDGVVLATGDRILIKNQASGAENGIYTVNASGAPTRATDADTGAELVGAVIFVSEGTANADLIYACTTNATITLNTTALVFSRVVQPGIQFKDEGSNVGTPGSITSVNFTGTAVVASEASGAMTVDVGTVVTNSGGMVYVGGSSVAGSPASSITVTGLDLNSDLIYFVVIKLRNTAATANTYYLTYNSDTTATNYFNENQSGGGATQANNPFIGSTFATANNENVIRGTISRPVNRVSSEWTGGPMGNATASMRQQSVVHQWTTTGTNVTSLTVSQSAGLAQLDTGSRIDVWKLTTTAGAVGVGTIQFKDEGSNLGSPTTVGNVNFVGSGVTAAFAGSTVTVTIPGGVDVGAVDDGAAMSRNTNQSIGTGAWTGITFTSEDHDDKGYCDLATNADRFTAPETGWYSISCFVYWDATSAAHGISISKNASNDAAPIAVTYHPTAGASQRQAVSCNAYLMATDYVQFAVWASTAAAIAGATVPARASIHRLGVANDGGFVDADLAFQDEGIDQGTINTVNFVGDGIETNLPGGGVLEVRVDRGIPQNVQAGDYTILQSDNGKHIMHASGAGSGDSYTWDLDTLDAGHSVTVFNLDSNPVSIEFTNGTGRWIGNGAGATGNRSLAPYGHATFVVTDAGDEVVFDGVLIS